MNGTVKTKKRWFLKVELAVLILVGGIGIAKIVPTDTDSTKVSIAKQVVRTPYKEKINGNTAKTKSETFGLVTGICYSKDKPSAVIDNKKIVHEGDTIDGVTIVKIYEDKVEFIKNDKSWVQKIESFHGGENKKQTISPLYLTKPPTINHSNQNSYHRKIYPSVPSYHQPLITNPSERSKTYLYTGSGHWVKKKIDSGNFIQLEDNSLWQVNPIDRIISSLWLYTEEIVVAESENPNYPYFLINTDDREKVEAKLIAD